MDRGVVVPCPYHLSPSAECQEKGGEVVGDIGDGAIHRPDYRCASGSAPIGSIRAAEGEPIAVEGPVCCPPSAS